MQRGFFPALGFADAIIQSKLSLGKIINSSSFHLLVFPPCRPNYARLHSEWWVVQDEQWANSEDVADNLLRDCILQSGGT